MNVRFYYNPLVKQYEDETYYIDMYASCGSFSKSIGRLEDSSPVTLMKKVNSVIWYLNEYHSNFNTFKIEIREYWDIFKKAILNII